MSTHEWTIGGLNFGAEVHLAGGERDPDATPACRMRRRIAG